MKKTKKTRSTASAAKMAALLAAVPTIALADYWAWQWQGTTVSEGSPCGGYWNCSGTCNTWDIQECTQYPDTGQDLCQPGQTDYVLAGVSYCEGGFFGCTCASC